MYQSKYRAIERRSSVPSNGTRILLAADYPDAQIQPEVRLRDASGKAAKDPLTGKGRRIDVAVIESGEVTDLIEVTSERAEKGAQLDKEARIREAGGAYIRDRKTGALLDVSKVLTRLMRFP